MIKLDKNIMALIEHYVDELCEKIDESADVVEDFREEMISNIICSVEDLISTGHSPKQALKIALERFGEPNKLILELGQLYHIRKTLACWLLKMAILSGVLGVLWVISFFIWNEGLSKGTVHSFSQQVIQKVTNRQIQDRIPDDLKKEATTFVDNHKGGINGIGIYFTNVGEAIEKVSYDYVYPNMINFNNYSNIFKGKGIFTVQWGETLKVRIDDTDREINVDFIQWKFSPTYLAVGIGFLYGYWLLFTAWGIMNLFYNRKNQLKWILLIAGLNVFGYWIYHRVSKGHKV